MRILPTALAATLLFGLPLAGQSDGPPRTSDETRFHSIVATLSGDEFGGRGVGTAGGAKARDWMIQQFRSLGLEPVEDGGPFRQPFRLDDGTEGCNIVGALPGSGTLAGEWVIVSAHYDHLGTKSDAPSAAAQIFHGADDNASGVAVMLMIAEGLKKANASATRRSVLFVAFDAEERGLLGSKHQVEHPVVPLDKTVAVVNFDMVGRLRRGKLYAGDASSCPDFAAVLSRLQSETCVAIEGRFGGVARSDQAPFLEKKIPAVHFNTGLYPEYHHAADTVDRVDHVGGAKIASIGQKFVDVLITHDGPLAYQKLDPSHDIQHAIRLVSTLGAIPNVRAQKGRYPQVLFVRPGSPAAKLGIHAGDELAEIDGMAIERVEDAVSLVPRLRFDRAIPVKFLREGAPIDVTFPAEVFASFAGPSVTPLPDGEHFEVTFRFIPLNGTKRVNLAGSFNTWDPDALPMTGPDANGAFTARVTLDRGVHEYRFLLDGHDWRPDPTNLHSVGNEPNSVVWAGTGLATGSD